MELDDHGVRPRYLIRDRDSKFTRDFDEVFWTDGTRGIKAPARTPNARAHAERWIGTVRRECLNRLLIFGRAGSNRCCPPTRSPTASTDPTAHSASDPRPKASATAKGSGRLSRSIESAATTGSAT
jgi:hypothetical protein